MMSLLTDDVLGGPPASGLQAKQAGDQLATGCPPALTGGADCQGPRIGAFTVSIHDLTASGSDYLRDGVVERLTRLFGEPEPCGSALFYREAIRWDAGAEVHWRPLDGKDHFSMRVRGKAWDLMTFAEQVQLLVDVAPGMKGTRIDLACDFEGARICAAVERACERRELVGAKQWDVRKPRCASTGEVLGHTVYLGSRSSPRFGRVYDKGLEQTSKGNGQWPAGQWERWEGELKDDVADQALKLMTTTKTPGETLAAIVFGSVDFRDGDDAHVDRRERVSWFDQLTRGLHLVRLKVQRVKADLASKMEWMKKCLRPFVDAVSALTGVVPGEVFEELTGGPRVNAFSYRGGGFVVTQAAELICGPPPVCDVPF